MLNRNHKGIIVACSVALAGVFAFSGSVNTYAGTNKTAVAGASAAMASAVASADAEIAAEDNKAAEAALKSVETKSTKATKAAVAETVETKSVNVEETERKAAEAKAAVEQAIVEQEAANEEAAKGASEEVKTQADSDVEGEAVEGIDWDGSKASEVVNYATQFVGNPYVWGGTSLTHGTDCSGFTMSVYKKFGKKLPHSSSGQRSVGKAVSIKNMKPGDLVCYDGHVALYCGNNTIVHASNPKTGIKYGHVFYRQIVAVRRVM